VSRIDADLSSAAGAGRLTSFAPSAITGAALRVDGGIIRTIL
jgi:hypothetical protein